MDMLAYIDNAYPKIGQEIEEKKDLTDALLEQIVSAAKEFKDKNR